jgi:hypothetical protein
VEGGRDRQEQSERRTGRAEGAEDENVSSNEDLEPPPGTSDDDDMMMMSILHGGTMGGRGDRGVLVVDLRSPAAADCYLRCYSGASEGTSGW